MNSQQSKSLQNDARAGVVEPQGRPPLPTTSSQLTSHPPAATTLRSEPRSGAAIRGEWDPSGRLSGDQLTLRHPAAPCRSHNLMGNCFTLHVISPKPRHPAGQKAGGPLPYAEDAEMGGKAKDQARPSDLPN